MSDQPSFEAQLERAVRAMLMRRFPVAELLAIYIDDEGVDPPPSIMVSIGVRIYRREFGITLILYLDMPEDGLIGYVVDRVSEWLGKEKTDPLDQGRDTLQQMEQTALAIGPGKRSVTFSGRELRETLGGLVDEVERLRSLWREERETLQQLCGSSDEGHQWTDGPGGMWSECVVCKIRREDVERER